MGPIKRPTYMKRLMSRGDNQTIMVISGLSRVSENLVFLEFKRRRRKIAACKAGERRVVMVEGDDGIPGYARAAVTVSYGEKPEQELKPLPAIPDNYPKYLMTPDEWFTRDHDGIATVNAPDFLAGQGI